MKKKIEELATDELLKEICSRSYGDLCFAARKIKDKLKSIDMCTPMKSDGGRGNYVGK